MRTHRIDKEGHHFIDFYGSEWEGTIKIGRVEFFGTNLLYYPPTREEIEQWLGRSPAADRE